MRVERGKTVINRVQLEFGKMFSLPGIIGKSASALGLSEEETTRLLVEAYLERAGKAEVIYGDVESAREHIQKALNLDTELQILRSSK